MARPGHVVSAYNSGPTWACVLYVGTQEVIRRGLASHSLCAIGLVRTWNEGSKGRKIASRRSRASDWAMQVLGLKVAVVLLKKAQDRL